MVKMNIKRIGSAKYFIVEEAEAALRRVLKRQYRLLLKKTTYDRRTQERIALDDFPKLEIVKTKIDIIAGTVLRDGRDESDLLRDFNIWFKKWFKEWLKQYLKRNPHLKPIRSRRDLICLAKP